MEKSQNIVKLIVAKKLLKKRNQTFPVVRYSTWKLVLVSNILWMILDGEMLPPCPGILAEAKNRVLCARWSAFVQTAFAINGLKSLSDQKTLHLRCLKGFWIGVWKCLLWKRNFSVDINIRNKFVFLNSSCSEKLPTALKNYLPSRSSWSVEVFAPKKQEYCILGISNYFERIIAEKKEVFWKSRCSKKVTTQRERALSFERNC